MDRLAVFIATFLLLHTTCLGQLDDFDDTLNLPGHWDNDFDAPLHFQCPSDSDAVTAIKSVHSNHHEDRRFELSCSNVGCSSHRKSCYWTAYINGYDQLIHFTCHSNYYINGVYSVHSNHHEDRVWRLRCCAVSGVPLINCELTGWTNHWDGNQHYTAPTNSVIKGMVSMHDNHREDRLYEYLVCEIGKIGATQRPSTLLEYLRLQMSNTAIISSNISNNNSSSSNNNNTISLP